MRRLAAALALACALAAPAPLLACSCMGPMTERDAVTRSDAVFDGRVIWVRKVRDGVYGEAIETTFLAGGWTKGSRARMVRVRSSTSSCGVTFRVGRRYRVYAEHPSGRRDGPLFTGACSAPLPRPAEPTAFRAVSRRAAPSRAT